MIYYIIKFIDKFKKGSRLKALHSFHSLDDSPMGVEINLRSVSGS